MAVLSEERAAFYFNHKAMPKKRILFVCLGNICRSPLAEEVFRTYLQRKGKEKDYILDSAGLISYHKGELPDERMRRHASRRGYVLQHRSRPVTTDDFYDFDYVIGMDESNILKLKDLAPGIEELDKIHRMIEFCEHPLIDHVPDPYYGGEQGFENVIDMVESACDNLFKTIENNK